MQSNYVRVPDNLHYGYLLFNLETTNKKVSQTIYIEKEEESIKLKSIILLEHNIIIISNTYSMHKHDS